MTVEKTYLGNFQDDMTEKQVKELFADHGKVLDIKINKEKVNVTVEYTSEEEAKKGKEALNKPPKKSKKWKFYWEPG